MKSEVDPITDDEWLLRRVHRDRFRTDKIPRVSPNAFEPRIKGRDPDTDGISLYREQCNNDPAAILAKIPEANQCDIAIVRIQVSFLKSMKLSVRNAPDEPIKGHVVIPELNSRDYEMKKADFIQIKLDLAEEASKDQNIVKYPTIWEAQ